MAVRDSPAVVTNSPGDREAPRLAARGDRRLRRQGRA